MSKICLVKKFKGVASGDLPVLDTIDFIITNTPAATDENYRLYIQRVDPTLEATIIGDGAFRDNAAMDSTIADKTINPNGYVRFTPGNYKIRFNKKENAIQGVFNSPLSVQFNLEMLKYNTNINDITINGAGWVDINEVVPYLNKNVITELRIDTPIDIANLSLFNTLTHLDALQVINAMFIGDIKNWVVAQVHAGRTTNSSGTDFKYCPGLTFNGTAITSKSPNKVTWEPATGGTSITMDGVTIVVDSNGNVIE